MGRNFLAKESRHRRKNIEGALAVRGVGRLSELKKFLIKFWPAFKLALFFYKKKLKSYSFQ
jgi:hypothetical protein